MKKRQKILDVKPRSGADYVPFFHWLISKRLAKTAALGIGVFGLCYFLLLHPPSIMGGRGIQTYDYDSLLLKFAKGSVRIRAKSGYIAYEGNVEHGAVLGIGTLYDASGEVIYTGEFVKNKYEGEGTLYYPGEKIHYQGTFRENEFSKEGVLYRKNGSKEYEGGFERGMKHGEGKLFDSGNNEIFAGNFSQDELLYSDFLGKTTEEISQVYHGRRKIYTDGGEEFSVAMEDIDAVYSGVQDGAALDDSMQVEGIYVLKNRISIKDRCCTSVFQLKELLGEPEYEGNASLTLTEAVVVSYLNEKEDSLFGSVKMEVVNEFSDVATVKDYDSEYLLYLYSFTEEGIRYTFFCKEKDGEFSMYRMEKG